MSIIDGKHSQPCPYFSGAWVTLMCPHPYISETQLVVLDDKYIKYQQTEYFTVNDDYKYSTCDTCGHECHRDKECPTCANDVCGFCKCDTCKGEKK